MTNGNDPKRRKIVDARQQAQTRWLLAIIAALVTVLALELVERFL
jgi:hypothetical protein